MRLALVKESVRNYNERKQEGGDSVEFEVSKGRYVMNIFELKFVVQNVVVQLEPEEVVQTVIEA